MSDKPNKEASDTCQEETFVEKRREERCPVPEVYQRYISMAVRDGETSVPAVLGNFSRHGILFESSVPFAAGAHTECTISISLLLSRDITFGIKVMYCYQNGGSHIVGASIDSISDEIWFDVFEEVHDFIVQRQGTVY
jgi:hypothetical protein